MYYLYSNFILNVKLSIIIIIIFFYKYLNIIYFINVFISINCDYMCLFI